MLLIYCGPLPAGPGPKEGNCHGGDRGQPEQEKVEVM